jgi:hypothetical protein
MPQLATVNVRALSVSAPVETSALPRVLVQGPAGDVFWLVELEGGGPILPARFNGKNYRRLLREVDAAQGALRVALQASLRCDPESGRLGLMDAGFRTAPSAMGSAVAAAPNGASSPAPEQSASAAGVATVRLGSLSASISINPSLLDGAARSAIQLDGYSDGIEIRLADQGGQQALKNGASSADVTSAVLHGELAVLPGTSQLVLAKARLEVEPRGAPVAGGVEALPPPKAPLAPAASAPPPAPAREAKPLSQVKPASEPKPVSAQPASLAQPASEAKMASQAKPASEAPPASLAPFVSEPKLVSQVKPASEAKLASQATPASEVAPASLAPFVSEPKLVSQVKPASEAKLASQAKPASEVAPASLAQFVSEPKLDSEVKPALEAKLVSQGELASEAPPASLARFVSEVKSASEAKLVSQAKSVSERAARATARAPAELQRQDPARSGAVSRAPTRRQAQSTTPVVLPASKPGPANKSGTAFEAALRRFVAAEVSRTLPPQLGPLERWVTDADTAKVTKPAAPESRDRKPRR